MARPDAFRFSNGQHADDARQLRAVLKLAPLDVTGQHISADRNDFVPWIRGVLGNEQLARKAEKCRSVHQLTSMLDEHLDGPAPKPRPQPQRAIPERTSEPHAPQLPRIEHHEQHYHPHASKDFLFGFALGVVLAIIIYATIQALL